MSDASSFGFGKFIPGFDFLQGLAQSAGAAASPQGGMPQWVAPTVSVEEVDKRIAELKAVQFWLEQNGRALAATIQALEVQRMTLSTLQGMNVSMSDLARSFQFPAGAGPAAEPPDAAPQGADAKEAAGTESAQAALNQAVQWWGALTGQFQQIAAKALAEPVSPETVMAAQRATEMASGLAKATLDQVMSFGKTPVEDAAQSVAKAAKAAQAATGTAARKTAARPAARKAAAKSGGSSRTS